MTLYRAAVGPSAPPGAHFSPSVATARAYLDNPGFGGPSLWRFEVEPARLLRATGRDGARRLADAVYPLLDEGCIPRDYRCFDGARELAEAWADAGYGHVYHVLENTTWVRTLLARTYDWIAFTDDYPEDGETWRYLRGPVLQGRWAGGRRSRAPLALGLFASRGVR